MGLLSIPHLAALAGGIPLHAPYRNVATPQSPPHSTTALLQVVSRLREVFELVDLSRYKFY